MTKMRTLRCAQLIGRAWHARCGTASVEFVLILPLISLMLLGTIEMGRVFNDYHVASKSLRDATRYASRLDGRTGSLAIDCAAGTIDNASPQAQEVKRLALTGSTAPIAPTTDYLLDYWTNLNDVTLSADCEPNAGPIYRGYYEGLDNVPAVVVSGQIAMPLLNGWIIGRGTTFSFTISHKMAHVPPEKQEIGQ